MERVFQNCASVLSRLCQEPLREVLASAGIHLIPDAIDVLTIYCLISIGYCRMMIDLHSQLDSSKYFLTFSLLLQLLFPINAAIFMIAYNVAEISWPFVIGSIVFLLLLPSLVLENKMVFFAPIIGVTVIVGIFAAINAGLSAVV